MDGQATLDAVEPAFDVWRCSDAPATPLVFASPHSGRCYPPEMMAAAALDAAAIRGSEDAFVDELIAAAPAAGASLIAARYARAYVDVNREAYELDQAMFDETLPEFARGRSARVAAGLGSIARVVADGQEIYTRKLSFAEARRRIEAAHRPYHDALAGLVAEAVAAHGFAILIDWHSMPAAAAKMAGRGRGCDMVLGDRFGSSCAPLVTATAERELMSLGYQVARNTPYAGGYTTEHYGRPARRVHALQIEINRALYVHEKTLVRTEGFERLRGDLDVFVRRLAAFDWRRLR